MASGTIVLGNSPQKQEQLVKAHKRVGANDKIRLACTDIDIQRFRM
jgi:hypothetical protein